MTVSCDTIYFFGALKLQPSRPQLQERWPISSARHGDCDLAPAGFPGAVTVAFFGLVDLIFLLIKFQRLRSRKTSPASNARAVNPSGRYFFQSAAAGAAPGGGTVVCAPAAWFGAGAAAMIEPMMSLRSV